MDSDKGPGPSSKAHMEWLDLVRGLGISMVVIVHFQPKGFPAYWGALQELVWLFQLPLMFLVSGCLAKAEGIGRIIVSKARRLLIPFACMAVLFAVGKTAGSAVTKLSFPLDAQAFLRLWYDPVHSFVPLLWFLPALFVISVTVAIYRKWVRWDWPLFLVSCAVMIPWAWSNTLLDQIVYFTPFFVIGPLFLHWFAKERRTLDWVALVGLSAIILGGSWWVGPEAPDLLIRFLKVPTGLAGSFLVFAAGRGLDHLLTPGMVRKMLLLVGTSSMSIYLFHPFFESSMRIALGKVGAPFLIAAGLSCFVGVAGPVLLDAQILQRFRWTRILILGLKK